MVPLEYLQLPDMALPFLQSCLKGLKLSLPGRGVIKSLMHRNNDSFIAPMSCQEEKDWDKRAKGNGKKMKRKKELGIHLIKADHGITEGRERLVTLPQIFPVGLAEAFI